MAAGFPTKANFATGDVLSATNMNDLAGTVNLINPSAKGDLYAGSAANTYTKLTVGANNTVLTADSSTATGLKWAAVSAPSFVGVSAKDNLDQAIANVTYTKLTFNGENFDTDAFHDNTTNTSRITIPSGKAGYYEITAWANWENNATGRRILALFKNNVAVQTIANETSSGYIGQIASYKINLAVGDYVEVAAYQDSGASRNVDDTRYFQAQFLGA